MTTEGKKFDEDKIRYDLIPPEAKRAIASQLKFGADKYGDRNWEKGLHFGRLVRATEGHLTEWWAGNDFDEDGRPHLHGAITSLAMLLSLVERYSGSEWDNRPVKPTDVNLNYGFPAFTFQYSPELFTIPHIPPVDEVENPEETDQSTGGNRVIHAKWTRMGKYGLHLCQTPFTRSLPLISNKASEVTCKRCLKLIGT